MITLFVAILQHTPLLSYIIEFVRPITRLVGLSGEAVVPLVHSNRLESFMEFLGMNRNTYMTLVAGFTIGLAYGAAY